MISSIFISDENFLSRHLGRFRPDLLMGENKKLVGTCMFFLSFFHETAQDEEAYSEVGCGAGRIDSRSRLRTFVDERLRGF